MPSYCAENYERSLYQSARTKDGKVAPLPLPYDEAWEEAHRERAARERGETVQ